MSSTHVLGRHFCLGFRALQKFVRSPFIFSCHEDKMRRHLTAGYIYSFRPTPKPPTTSKSTLEHPNNIFQSAFEKVESLKSCGGLCGGGVVAMGHKQSIRLAHFQILLS